MINEWKNDFLNRQPNPERIYIISSYFSVLKLQNYSSQSRGCGFLQKNWRKIVLSHRDNQRGKCNQIHYDLSHTIYDIAGAKALCSILYSSWNIQIKSYWVPVESPSVTLRWQKPQLSRSLIILLTFVNT